MKKKQSICFPFGYIAHYCSFLSSKQHFSDPSRLTGHHCLPCLWNKRLDNVTIHIPNVTSVYQQALTANTARTRIFFCSHIRGNWRMNSLGSLTISAAQAAFHNARGFCSGNLTETGFQPNNRSILAAIEVCNVKWLRFAEVVSRHMNATWRFQRNMSQPSSTSAETTTWSSSDEWRLKRLRK